MLLFVSVYHLTRAPATAAGSRKAEVAAQGRQASGRTRSEACFT
ncbi:hypothetical protein [Bacillus sp. 2205SS5-2]